jgi:hypothetical protein
MLLGPLGVLLLELVGALAWWGEGLLPCVVLGCFAGALLFAGVGLG